MHPRAVWHAQTSIRTATTRPSRYLRRWRALHTSSSLFHPESSSSSSTTPDDAHKEDSSATGNRRDIETSTPQDESSHSESAPPSSTQNQDEDTVTSLNEQLRVARRKALLLDQEIRDGGRRRSSMRGKRSMLAEVQPVELPNWFTQQNIQTFQQLNESNADNIAAYRAIVKILIDRINSKPSSNDSQPESGREGQAVVYGTVWSEMFLTLRGSFAMVEHKASPSFATAKAHMSLFSPIDGTLDWLRKTVATLAVHSRADVMCLDAFALSRIGETILPRPSDVADHPIRSLSFDTHKEEVEEEMEEDEEEDEDEQDDAPRRGIMVVKRLKGGPVDGIPPELSQLFGKSLKVAGGGSDSAPIVIPGMGVQEAREVARNSTEGQAMTGMFEAMIDAWLKNRGAGAENSQNTTKQQVTPLSEDTQGRSVLSTLVDSMKKPFEQSNDETSQSTPKIDLAASSGISDEFFSDQPRLIIQIADAAFLTNTSVGLKLMDSLLDVVQRRRAAGQQIVIMGISASSRFAAEVDAEAAQRRTHLRNAETLYRPFFVVPITGKSSSHHPNERERARTEGAETMPAPSTKLPPSTSTSLMQKSSGSSLGGWDFIRKYERISTNLRHIYDLSLRMAAPDILSNQELETSLSPHTKEWSLNLDKELKLLNEDRENLSPGRKIVHDIFERNASRILEQSEVHAIALIFTGILTMRRSETRGAPGAKDLLHAWALYDAAAVARSKIKIDSLKAPPHKVKDAMDRSTTPQLPDPLEGVRKNGNKYEQRLLHSAVSARNIKTTFDQVHVQPSTIETLRTLTSLSLQRPDAFRYGVLAADTIPGLLLYGPPGTGKTLLAKAVAKESGAAMLSISGADVNHMYVGESEKSVKAIFSVARKMAPCVVFVDEADSIFGSRSQVRQKPSHRDTINQFLREWDGLDERSVFLMVATNRPFDLDDAVLRRLARRVLVDLPTKEDREAILRIHLRDENLDSSVDLAALAEKTPFYSGSDLKNVAVAAALTCVREELAAEESLKREQATLAANAHAERRDASSADQSLQSPSSAAEASAEASSTSITETDAPTQAYVRPARRTLFERHFTKALEEISASVGEDMASLQAMKKFDEQYGDRKGRRKKNPYGFLDVAAQEKNARVRV